MTHGYRIVPIEAIVEGGDNVRRDIGDVTELADSIKRFGILQPLIVAPQDGELILVAGHRRLAAAKHLRLQHVPIAERVLDADERVEAMLSENLHRKNLTVLEEAEAFRRIMRRDGISQADLARRLGVSETTVSNRMQFFKLAPHVQRDVLEGRIGLQRALDLHQRVHRDGDRNHSEEWKDRKAHIAGSKLPATVFVIIAFSAGQRPEAVHAIADRERAFNVRDELARTCKVFIYPCEIDTTRGNMWEEEAPKAVSVG